MLEKRMKFLGEVERLADSMGVEVRNIYIYIYIYIYNLMYNI